MSAADKSIFDAVISSQSSIDSNPDKLPIDQPKAKRTKLCRTDMVAAQSLNPMGRSVLAEMPLIRLWSGVSQGNKWLCYNTEFADLDPFRIFASSKGCYLLVVCYLTIMLKLFSRTTF